MNQIRFGETLSQSLQDSENFFFIFIPCLARNIFQLFTEMAEPSSERCLDPELRQALDDLKTAVHSANCCLTTSRFLDSFPDLSTQHPEIQRAVEKVARFSRDQEENAAQAAKKARTTFEALSPEHQHGLMQYYGEDINFYLEIATPRPVAHSLSFFKGISGFVI
ncbi:hypothetical protein N7519_006279 [Penicillium mononematosum]|uniref:uncharacterized protein n=1 Tax=Penicillium mononematosum TaxID=268346 RepID=UPI0025477E6D|nr:uncharacterized protein N7519_006279 [Penicillium mononematosum]KAJ6184978.1 hypothetical protein N7519_006279 [Penicillium mononematosum]